MNNLVNTKEVIETLGISLWTLARFRDSGMPYIKVTRKPLRYDMDAVMEWIIVRGEENKAAGAEMNE